MFPGLFAPHSPDDLVGPRFLAPGAHPDLPALILPSDSPDNELIDLAVPSDQPRPIVAVVQGVPTSGALNEQAQVIDNQIKNEPGGLRLRPRIERYATLEEALQAVVNGKATAAVVQSLEFEAISAQFPTLREGASITGERSTAGGFFLGTNDIGQDVLSRLLWGTRIALIIGFSSSLVALFLGVPLGLFAGFVGGSLDRSLSLVMDSLYAFPGLILAIAITAVLGPSMLNIIVAIAVLYIPTYYRIVRGQTLSVKEEVYVEAAKSIGARNLEILQKYIFPNVIPSVAIIFSVNVADAILTGAGLSFLGLGLPPTIADWGIDLARGQRFIQTAWWMITFPGLAIMLVVLAFSMMGEGLTEIFNPKLRER
ncbi:MAG: peptide ABC transporter permease [Anaerolineae bacterium CG03_land_8_20_14_0_80_58_20]|nr:MAG: peptide ABC transporter permease [Anaerolineae bacterium CG06_land_8_20_14_3_00_57_67]PIV26635.1 MAG: peptide ABC transporter permease [Anaerolineae bacterium CG03_land_8_20_14_0_80_58_20]